MTSVKAISIPADRDKPMEYVTITDDNDYFLQSMQEAVHGWIERVIIGDCRTHKRFQNVAMYVNEESAIRPGFEVNPRASILYGSPIHGGVIYGDTIVVGESAGNVSELPVGFTIDLLERFIGLFVPAQQ